MKFYGIVFYVWNSSTTNILLLVKLSFLTEYVKEEIIVFYDVALVGLGMSGSSLDAASLSLFSWALWSTPLP